MKANVYIIAFLATFIFSECSYDSLYQDPSTSLTDEIVLQTKEKANSALMGAYAWTGDYRYLTIGEISLDVMGNDLKMSDGTHKFSTYNWLMFAYNYVQYPHTVDGWWSAYAPYLWKYAYKAIDQSNFIIANANKLPAGCEDIVAQAYGIRGYNYLNLYHLFCASYTHAGASGQGLFLRLTPGNADGNDVVRSPLGVSLQRIIDDFTYAHEHCTQTSNYFINSQNAALLLARTYLDMGDYANAKKYAEIACPVFDGSNLMSKDEYQSGFNTANSEWLWGFNFVSETSNIYASIPSFYHAATFKDENSTFGTAGYGSQASYDYLADNSVDWMTGYSTVRVTWSFASMFGDDDCRALFPFYIHADDGLFTSKYSSKGSLGIADYPLCRMAEAYLIEAECLARANDSRALSVLNALQTKRGGTISTSISVDEVWNERRRELYGEGFALTDIKRLQKPLTRVGDEHWSEVKNLPANSPRMMFPIPSDELNYNKSATAADQNEYWRN